MMIIPTLAKMSEESKRIIIALLLIVIVLLLLIGAIGNGIRKIMQNQGKKADVLVYNVFKAGNISDEAKMRRFAIRKNWRQHVKEAWIPFVIMVGSWLILLLYCMTMGNFHVNIFDRYEEGILTWFYTFDWTNVRRVDWFGLSIIADWPPVLTSPHWSWKAWGAYLFVPGFASGALWYLYCVQAYIARSFRLRKIIKEHFAPSVDKLGDVDLKTPINPE